MIRQIFSRVDQLLLASVLNVNAVPVGRHDSADQHELLQVSALHLLSGRKINAHKHLPTIRHTTGTQECWVILAGSVSVRLFDVDTEQIDDFVLSGGTCLTIYRGGHALEVLNDAIIVEIKNGPYYGAQLDLQPID